MSFHGISLRKPIEEMYPIRYHILVASILICASLVLILVPGRGIAQTGSISGKVHEYLHPTVPIYGIQVTVFDQSNSPVRNVMTDPNFPYDPNSTEPKWVDGYFKIDKLPVGKYRVCAMGPTYDEDGDPIYWVSECYETNCTGPQCGYYITEYPEDFANTLVQVNQGLTTTGVNFYLAGAGQIEGDVYTHTGYPDYYVSYKMTVKYKDNPPLVLPQYSSANITDEGYRIVNCAPGDYIIKVEDWIQVTNPYDAYYMTLYWPQKYAEAQATRITLGCGQNNVKTGINFQMKTGGVIQGYIKKQKENDPNQVNTRFADVVLIEENLGYMQTMQTNQFPIVDPGDPNHVVSFVTGRYKFGGLSPGNYALYAELVGAQGENDPEPPNIDYLGEFYNNLHFKSQLDPSYEQQITRIAITGPDQTKNIDVVLDRAPKLSGKVTRSGTSTALPGIQIFINEKSTGRFIADTTTDSTGNYLFESSRGILPTLYTVTAWDPNAVYVPSESDITMAVNQQYTKNLSMTIGSTGVGTISGRVFLDDDPAEPIGGIHVVAYSISLKKAYETTTNVNGEYMIEGIRSGYVLVFTGKEEEVMSRLYKDLNVPPDGYQQSPENLDQLVIIAGSQRRLYLGVNEHIAGIDIGVSSFRHTFNSGLNLYGYPGEPVVEYETAYKLCKGIGDDLHKLVWLDANTDAWHSVWLNTADPNHPPVGVNCSITPGNGYIIFMNETVESMVLPPFTITFPDYYALESGKNLFSYPPSLYRPLQTSSELISAIDDPDAVSCVRSYDSFTGQWKSNVRIWGRPCSGVFPLRQGDAYLVEMRSFQYLIPPQ
ncbi:MAG: hypothetical protein ACMUIS_03240 [bacterium]